MNPPDVEAETAENHRTHHKAHLIVEGVPSLDDLAATDGFVVEHAEEELGTEDNVQRDRSCNLVSVSSGHPIGRWRTRLEDDTSKHDVAASLCTLVAVHGRCSGGATECLYD